MVWVILYVIIPRDNLLLDFKEISWKGGGGFGSELESRADIFKYIARHKLVDTNWALTKKVYRGVTKLIHLIDSKVSCYQQTETNGPEDLTKFKWRDFDSSIRLHNNVFIDEHVL